MFKDCGRQKSFCLAIYSIAGNFHEHKYLQITNKHTCEKNLAIFNLQQGHNLSPHPLQSQTGKWQPRHGTQHVFQCQNNSITLIKACGSLSAKNYSAKVSNLTPRIRWQLQ